MVHSFFEGPEKKLELVINPGQPSLRSLGRDRWAAIVAAARANILSVISTEHVDAYLLSESSLFVFPDHVTMITCGRTRLIDAAIALIELVGAGNVSLVVYERKNEHFPERQPTTFLEDAARLDAVIPGTAHRFGSDHDHRIEMFVSAAGFTPDTGDVTLEVLMHGLGADNNFTGLDRLLDGFEIDEYRFEPAGYSLNAVRGPLYYTVHVTPENEGSYASFETNWDFTADLQPLIGRIIESFAPETVDVLSFVPSADPLVCQIPGYTCRKHVAAALAGYQITFVSSFRPQGLERPVDLVVAR